ncbi:MAG TPA: ATP-binding protein, partial [Hyphomicrobiaceae bacterium]|nr:ATP-binding protein [Hyphomicrobiaceae bacterium]
MAARALLGIDDIHIMFIIPVVVAATRFSFLAGLAAAFVGTAASAFFLYAPIYSFLVLSAQDVIALTIFIVVSAITSHLATQARAHWASAQRSYSELERLYGFSRRLAVARAPEEIFAAIQEHVSALVGSSVRVVTADSMELDRGSMATTLARNADDRPSEWMQNGDLLQRSRLVRDVEKNRNWLVRSFSGKAGKPYVLLVDLEPARLADLPLLQHEVDALLDDAIATLERLDVATALTEAGTRQQSEALRDAIIGSVSHSLRTPLASILGSASILVAAQPIAEDQRLADLAGIIVNEAERLNGDIQKMLDAAALTSSGVKPVPAWMEATDLVNAALESKRRELAHHVIVTDYAKDLPLVRADATMIREALGLILDNAARYSQQGTTIRIAARSEAGAVTISIEDEGVGLEAQEHSRAFEKFYRGVRVRDTTRGSGLGLWIANAFVGACGGQLAIKQRDNVRGTRLL